MLSLYDLTVFKVILKLFTVLFNDELFICFVEITPYFLNAYGNTSQYSLRDWSMSFSADPSLAAAFSV